MKQTYHPSPEPQYHRILDGFPRWHYYGHKVPDKTKSSRNWSSHLIKFGQLFQPILHAPTHLQLKSLIKFRLHPATSSIFVEGVIGVFNSFNSCDVFGPRYYRSKNQVLSSCFLRWQSLPSRPSRSKRPPERS